MRKPRTPKYAIEDYLGKTYGSWTVIGLSLARQKDRAYIWKVRCVCGNESGVRPCHLFRGLSVQCRPCAVKRYFSDKSVRITALSRAIKRAQKHNREVSIDHEYIHQLWLKQDGKCALTGIPLDQSSIRPSASLDRIDSSRGYVPGNVQWVHKHINLMKNQLHETYFIEMCRRVVEHAAPDQFAS